MVKKTRSKKKEKQVIGRKEKISLPDFDLHNLDAKVDTGAYSSSIHCRILGETRIDDLDYIRFIPLGKKYKARYARQMLIPISKHKLVKSSSGHQQQRYFINLKVELGGTVVETEFSLSDRSSMRHTILLGRRFLKNHFIVDVSRTYIFQKKAKKRIIDE